MYISSSMSAMHNLAVSEITSIAHSVRGPRGVVDKLMSVHTELKAL